jgi:hypothetical protein
MFWVFCADGSSTGRAFHAGVVRSNPPALQLTGGLRWADNPSSKKQSRYILQSEKNMSLNILLIYSDLAPVQIHNHAHNPVGIYLKNWVQHKWHKLYFTQQRWTDNNSLVFKCILHNIIMRYTNNFTSYIISRLFAVRNKYQFYSVLTNSVAQESQGSSPHWQQPATGPCPEPVESNPQPPSQSP